jgi:ABC-type hemin transport system ATPase subunit
MTEVLILGPEGAGKSVLLRRLTGVLEMMQKDFYSSTFVCVVWVQMLLKAIQIPLLKA